MANTRKRTGNGTPNIAAQLRARGTTIDLGGSQVKLVIGWQAVEALEAEWGSLKAWGIELKKGADGRVFRCVGAGIAACLPDLPVDARSLMDLNKLAEYTEALIAALIESDVWQEDGDSGNPPGAPTAPSPGPDSGTTTSSAGTSAQPSSGA